jgi:hypothetical protein
VRHRFPVALVLCGALALTGLGTAAAVQAQALDEVGLSVVSSGHAKIRLTVTAGPSGAPAGFEVCWLTSAQYEANGRTWPPPWAPGEGWVDYIGIGTNNTWGFTSLDYQLAPGQSVDVEVGDSFDESGVEGTWTWQLDGGTSYVLCAYAVAPGGGLSGPLSVILERSTSEEGRHCTYSYGYWKKHPSSWPVSSLTLGSVNYNAAQLQQILNTPALGNGLISLAHQLIAAKFNVLIGANPLTINSTLTAADALIGSLVVPPVGAGYLAPSSTSGMTQILDEFNNDDDDHEKCQPVPTRTSTWGSLKSSYR